MNLGRQIHTLLKRQSSVYVNRLGTFKRVHKPATFDAKRHVFLPPMTFIEFDRISVEGYDFVTYVQQANQIERTEAESFVDQAVSAVLDKINQFGQAHLDNLGQLISYGNSYVFKPLDLSGFNYTAVEDNFPVDNIVIGEEIVTGEEMMDSDTVKTPVSVPEKEVPEVEPVYAEDKKEGVVPPVVTASEVAEEVDTVDCAVLPEEERKSTGAYVYALVGLVAVALLGGLYYYSTYMQESPVLANKEPVVVSQDTLVTELPIDSIVTVPDSTGIFLEPKEVVKEIPPPINHRYTIVIGTHRTLAQAYEEAEAFNKDGHKSVRVITPNLAKNLKRVVWDTYASKEERDSALRYVKKHIKTDAWPDVIK